MNRTHERTAIVTGASRGFGLATAQALVDAGWHVVVDARGREDLERATEAFGDKASAIAGDVADPAHRRGLVDTATAAGRLELLVNNASMLGPSPQPRLDSYPLDVLRRVYEVNVIAPLALTQLALPLLRESSGVVVNVTSDAAAEAYEGWGGYGSSKAALNQATNILSAEEPDLSVYHFDPGDMNTRMHQEAFPDEDISDRPSPKASVPALLALVEGGPPSGLYRARDMLMSAS